MAQSLYSRVIFKLDVVVVGEFNRLVAESMHSLVNHLSVLFVTTVNIHIVLSSTSQPASAAVNNDTRAVVYTMIITEASIHGGGGEGVIALPQ